MATPHVGGIAGLVLNAAPSLGVADYHRDDHDFGSSLVGVASPPAGQGGGWALGCQGRQGWLRDGARVPGLGPGRACVYSQWWLLLSDYP